MIITSWLSYIIFIAFVNISTIFNSVATMAVAFNSPTFYLTVVLVCGVCFLFDLTIFTLKVNFSESLANSLRKIVSLKDNPIEKEDLPPEIKNLLTPYEAVPERDDRSEISQPKKKDYVAGKYTPISREVNLPSENFKFNQILDQSSKLVLRENR